MDAVELLIAQLLDGPADERREAALALGHSEDPRAVRPLIHVLDHPDDRLFGYVIGALGSLGPLAVPELSGMLREGPGPVSTRARTGALSALGISADPRAVPAVAEVLSGPDPYLQGLAADTLGRIGTAEVIRPLARALFEGNPRAGKALADVKDPAVVQVLGSALAHEFPPVRVQAAIALGTRGDPRAISPLCEALTTATGALGCSIAEALSHIAERHPAPGLRAALPGLKRLLTPWSLESLAARAIYRRLMEQVKALDAGMSLPLPAEAPEATHGLPIPAETREHQPETLPRPANPCEPR